ncbi:MAG TPA: citramalate synthase [Streptosporangiaceae bacterium]|jgi:2-isopropylmalate synthase|nr:citramalate synthase [Streptosporangiaceae bacterium]
MAGPKVEIYDTTLRDGSQQVGLDLTVADKLRVAQALDSLGVDVIEGGWPGSNPKDAEFFERAKSLELKHATLAAFGATRLPGRVVEDDASLAALLAAETPVVALVGKAWTLHVDEALRTSRAENLAMVADSVAYMAAAGRRVVFDAEHFFDGYQADRGYALDVLAAAADAGADTLVLCDTNGGTLPDDVGRIVAEVADRSRTAVGVHFHNDASCAVANSVVAVAAGSLHVQGAANGYGERCGNADLFSIIASLELKRGHSLLPDGRLAALASTARTIADVANLPFEARQAYVGSSAFATKAGLHASAIARRPDAYSHVNPEAVGNETQVLVSELAGRSNVMAKAAELGLDLSSDPSLAGRVLDEVKEAEYRGYAFEAADASFDLLVRRSAGVLPAWFRLEGYRVVIERAGSNDRSEAIVRLLLGSDRVVAVGEGVGPVHALDQALRRGLSEVYPALAGMHLVDYKVRILDGRAATSAVTRVMLTTADADGEWTTVGVSDDIVTASWEALADGVVYGLLRAGVQALSDDHLTQPGTPLGSAEPEISEAV